MVDVRRRTFADAPCRAMPFAAGFAAGAAVALAVAALCRGCCGGGQECVYEVRVPHDGGMTNIVEIARCPR